MKYSNQTVKTQGEKRGRRNFVRTYDADKKFSQSTSYVDYVDNGGAPGAPPPVKQPKVPPVKTSVNINAYSVG